MNPYQCIRLQSAFFDKDGGAGDGTNTDDKGTQPNAGGNGGDDAAKQEALNKQFAERARRAEEAERKKIFEAIGVTDQAGFETFLKAKKEAEDKAKTDTQRLQDDLTKATERADKLATDHKVEKEALQKRVIDTEIKVAASAEVLDKDNQVTRKAFRKDALPDVLVLIDRSKIALGEDGQVTGIEEAVAELAKAKPWMLADGKVTTEKKQKGTPGGGTRKSGGKPEKSEEDEEDTPIFTTL